MDWRKDEEACGWELRGPGDTYPYPGAWRSGSGCGQVFPSLGLSVLVCKVGISPALALLLVYPTGGIPVPLFAVIVAHEQHQTVL